MGFHVGIDVGKEQLDWALGPDASIERIANAPKAIRQLVRRLKKLEVERIVLESTGGYERLLYTVLAEADLPVVRINPWRVRRFAEGMGILAKTDPLDAHVLALFAERAEPPQRPHPGPAEQRLAAWIARRRQLIAMLTAEKNRLDTAPSEVVSDIRSLVRVLEGRIAKLDDKIDAALLADPDRAEISDRLQAVPGVGPGLVRTILIDLPEIGALRRRQISALVGLAPFAKDSGKKRGTRHIRGGRAPVRTALYLSAMNAARFNPVLKASYDGLRARGKPPKVAFVAIARKLLTILNAMVRDGSHWEELATP
jgi:transposase